MKTSSLSNLRVPLLALFLLLTLLLVLVLLPNPLQLKKPQALAHIAPLVVRHAPAPVLRHVSDVRHHPPRP
ncbi:hypothetical protein [Hymenobacter sp. YC55]|uniref:hypothetical protein n=1 Tax=Hymenobacter sp. YC55 TaxID=3034019 RepID=UPI0023F9FD67|nr:hypothetical protein [Hymenobacter sp. YC55]MDF7811342.1 hypothetical protein [Hymenobacter sp. YC55]